MCARSFLPRSTGPSRRVHPRRYRRRRTTPSGRRSRSPAYPAQCSRGTSPRRSTRLCWAWHRRTARLRRERRDRRVAMGGLQLSRPDDQRAERHRVPDENPHHRPRARRLFAPDRVRHWGLEIGVSESQAASGGSRARPSGPQRAVVGAFASMHVREAEESLTDTLHLVGLPIAGGLLLVIIGLGAGTFGRRFRLYTAATVLVTLVFSAWSGMDGAAIADNLATPWVGVKERIAVYSYQRGWWSSPSPSSSTPRGPCRRPYEGRGRAGTHDGGIGARKSRSARPEVSARRDGDWPQRGVRSSEAPGVASPSKRPAW